MRDRMVERPSRLEPGIGGQPARPLEVLDRGNVLVMLILPLLAFAAAYEPLVITSRALVVVVLLLSVSAAFEVKDRQARYIGALLSVIIACGAVHADWSNGQTYVQIAQLAVLGSIIAVPRRASVPAIGGGISLSLMLAVLAVLACAALLEPPGGESDSSLVLPFANWLVLPFANGNAAGLVVLCSGLLAIGYLDSAGAEGVRAFLILILGICISLLVGTGSRTGLAALLLATAIYWILSRMVVARRVLRAVRNAAILAIPLVTIGYPVYANFVAGEYGQVLIGGKGLASGRQVIWPLVMAAALEKPIVGHGLGSLPGFLLPDQYEGLSSHSGFLQILYQTGLIGAVCYMALFVILFNRAIAQATVRARAFGVACLVALVIVELFEVVLTQNHFVIGCAFWIVSVTVFIRPTRNGRELTQRRRGSSSIEAVPTAAASPYGLGN